LCGIKKWYHAEKMAESTLFKYLDVSCNPEIKIYQMKIDPEAFRLKEELITIQ